METCDCEVDFILGPSGQPMGWEIKYCHKHAAAPEMYEALRALFFKIEIADYNHAEYYEAERVLALANGEGGDDE